ncbi:MAG: S4 domain-containing protein, partial [Desulfosalsimonas sp.]
MPKDQSRRVRLQKYLADSGVCSRRKGEQYIRQGLVRVNGKTVIQLGTTVDPQKDVVEVSEKRVRPEQENLYIKLNKPAGYLSTCSQPGRKIVLDLVEVDRRVF